MELLSHKLELLPITKTQTLTHITHTNYRYDTIVANYSIFPPFFAFCYVVLLNKENKERYESTFRTTRKEEKKKTLT